jgi:acetylornithine deacetylase/succinyl-diaminopimelate desuccinylase-like protein
VPDAELRGEAAGLLRRLVTCDTSNPPGREAQAAAVVEDHLAGTGVVCERVAKDPERPNLVARLRGDGTAPSLAFLGHLDVVPVRREDWSVDPFAGVERDGAVWGRGSVDMKSQVAATTVALASLAREGYRPGGDLLLVLTADEEVGDAGVGAPFLAEARPDLCPDFVVGEGAGERIPTAAGPIYLLDRGIKATATATLTAFGEAGDASLPDTGASAVDELARLLTRLREYRAPVTVLPELEPLLDALGTSGEDASRRHGRPTRHSTSSWQASSAASSGRPWSRRSGRRTSCRIARRRRSSASCCRVARAATPRPSSGARWVPAATSST